ncbi:30S ribosomal protein S21 [Dissostichus eleginoides]|uniref:30S ribosomal protein S21 n=1 Tax=Dissostichus eleginoides TaxID=100907 RepID=A0AAD9BXN5_DISEL|nr:30S ribosomal protein S21 [Dissostichus eleginoides]
MFDETTDFSNTAQPSYVLSKTLDMQFNLARIADFCLIDQREKAKFNDIFEKTVQAVGQPSTLRRNPDVHADYSQLHAAIIVKTYSHKAGIDLKIIKD